MANNSQYISCVDIFHVSTCVFHVSTYFMCRQFVSCVDIMSICHVRVKKKSCWLTHDMCHKCYDICRMPLNFLTVAYDDICYIGNNSQHILCVYICHVLAYKSSIFHVLTYVIILYVNIINICHVSRKKIICVDT